MLNQPNEQQLKPTVVKESLGTTDITAVPSQDTPITDGNGTKGVGNDQITLIPAQQPAQPDNPQVD